MFPMNQQQRQQPCNNRNCPPFGYPLSQSQARMNNNPFNHLNAPYNSFMFEAQRSEPGRQARSAIFGWGPSSNFQNNPFKNAYNNQPGNRPSQPALPPPQNDISQNLNQAMNNNNEGLRRNLSEGNQRVPEGQQNQGNEPAQQNQQNLHISQNNAQQPQQNQQGSNQPNPNLSQSQRFWCQWGQPDHNISNRLFNNSTAQQFGFNPNSFQNGPPSNLSRQGSMNMESSNDLALELERFNRFFNINPDVYRQRRNNNLNASDVTCKFCPKKAHQTTHMVCQECVTQEQTQLRKFFEIKMKQAEEKQKASVDEIRKLRRQLTQAEREKHERSVQNEQQTIGLRQKLAQQTAQNMELLQKITRLKDIVKVEENFKEQGKLLTEENNEGWSNIYQWAEKFNEFSKRLLVLLPKRGNQISKLIIKAEEELIFTLQHKLSNIPKEIIDTVEEAQEEKRNELKCLKETQQQVLTVLESQKAAFEKCDTAFPELTLNLAIEPFKAGIANLQKHIDQLEEAKSELTLFSIFNIDRVGSAGSSRRGADKNGEEKMSQSRAEVLSQDESSPLGVNKDRRKDEAEQ